jgi:hypothetical protein
MQFNDDGVFRPKNCCQKATSCCRPYPDALTHEEKRRLNDVAVAENLEPTLKSESITWVLWGQCITAFPYVTLIFLPPYLTDLAQRHAYLRLSPPSEYVYIGSSFVAAL